jgi:uncharacterized repeat protein (TIGR03806 family)
MIKKMKRLTLTLVLLTLVLLNGCSSDDSPPVNPGDDQNPTAPANLTVNNITNNSLQLTWEAATDNIAVTGYNIYQDGALAQSVTATTVSVGGLMPETPYNFYVTATDAAGNESAGSNAVTTTTLEAPLQFLPNLTQMGIFQGELENLEPAAGVQLYEISSTLFTDYAYKQRLIKLPQGSSLRYNNSDLLPEFPNNTLIAKTFYYNVDERDPSAGKIVIETRLFLKLQEGWQVADYIWNSSQAEAVLDNNGGVRPISYIDIDGNTRDVEYIIPSQQDCFTCHNNNGSTFPIGMKLRSLNFVPSYTSQNQLQLFIDSGLISGLGDAGSISTLPVWTDEINFNLPERARAYLDVNCAHCHQPGGSVPPGFMMDFRYETPFEQTSIYEKRGAIEARFASTIPTFRMPQLGRTVVHQEALDMLVEYLESLD